MAKFALIFLALTLNGCAAYTAVSLTSWGSTGKGLADHGVSLATGADCNAAHAVMKNQDYYCEKPREPGSTYNRNAF